MLPVRACGVIICEISMHKKQFSAGSVDVKEKALFCLTGQLVRAL